MKNILCLVTIGVFILALSSVTTASDISGYTRGHPDVKTAPYSLDDLELLKATVLFTKEDADWLRESRKVLEPHAEEILDTWYGFVGSNPHLLYYFQDENGKPNAEYLARVRERFIQWIFDTADAKYDQDWLNYQYEIGLRHTRVSKNRTDKVKSVDHINYRYVMALLYPVTATLKPFLEKGDHSQEEVNAMHQAWIKSVLIQLILWSHPYIKEGDF